MSIAASANLTAMVGKAWKKPPFIKKPWLRWGLLILSVVYLVLAISSVEVDWSRVYIGLERGARFVTAFANPDFSSQWENISEGMYESIVMTVASSVVGIAISIPIGLGAARNIAPAPVYFVCRGIISISRALQEFVIAILLVAIFGFGPFAGFVTLSFATIGFLSKLLAEEIEAMDPIQGEAVKATGARWWQWINYGVQPQFMPRLIGLSIYRVDINFRESAILGLVGAGGIGATLATSFDRYDYDTSAAILLMIIGIVMVLEYVSGFVRGKVQ